MGTGNKIGGESSRVRRKGQNGGVEEGESERETEREKGESEVSEVGIRAFVMASPNPRGYQSPEP